MENNSKRKLMTVKEIQHEILGCSYRKAKALALQYFPSIRINNTYYFKRSIVEKALLGDENLVYNPKYK